MKFLLSLVLTLMSSVSFALNHETCNVSKLEIELLFHLDKQEVRNIKEQIKNELLSKGFNLDQNEYDGLHISIEQYEEHYDDYLPGIMSSVEVSALTENKRKISKGINFDVLYKKQREVFEDIPKSVDFILKKIPKCKIRS